MTKQQARMYVFCVCLYSTCNLDNSFICNLWSAKACYNARTWMLNLKLVVQLLEYTFLLLQVDGPYVIDVWMNYN